LTLKLKFYSIRK